MDIIFDIHKANFGGVGVIILNRLNNLNAITYDMMQDIIGRLLEWEDDFDIECIVIKSAHAKAFCAGGDIKQLRENKLKGADLTPFFYNEYRLNRLIHVYKKPIISLMDGVTMGGGVGLAMHAKYPIASENFVFAMPETKIGLFPDVGGRHVLNKAPNLVAMYLALSGRSVTSVDAFNLGLVNYYLPSDFLKDFISIISEFNSLVELANYLRSLKQKPSAKFEQLDVIEECFSFNSIEEIMVCLNSKEDLWSKNLYKDLMYCAPLSLKVTFKAMKLVKDQTLEDCLFTDFRIIQRFLARMDFLEGIRALLVDKDKQPNWFPSTLEDVTKDMVNEFFAPLLEELTWISEV